MKKLVLFLVVSFSYVIGLQAQIPLILSQREQAEVRDQMLKARFEKVLPELMRREGIDLWVIISREYNEDAENLSALHLALGSAHDDAAHL